MKSQTFLQKLRSLGIQLAPDGDKLRYKAPKGALAPELRQELMEYKAEIIALLRYKTSEAVFYPHIGRQVRTPNGRGTLWQIFEVRVGVVD